MEILIKLAVSFILPFLLIFAILLLLTGIYKYAIFLEGQRKRKAPNIQLAFNTAKFIFGRELSESVPLRKIAKISILSTIGIYLVLVVYVVASR
ncbi:MAG: hypothetical protein K6L80_12125 [Agarilytica sp.]